MIAADESAAGSVIDAGKSTNGCVKGPSGSSCAVCMLSWTDEFAYAIEGIAEGAMSPPSLGTYITALTLTYISEHRERHVPRLIRSFDIFVMFSCSLVVEKNVVRGIDEGRWVRPIYIR